MTPASAPRLPGLFLAGFTKCATSSLHDWLVQHPAICGGLRKELDFLYDPESHFFNPDSNVHAQGLAGYGALFPPASPGALLLDATPAYAYHRTARQVIAALPHRPMAIFVTRDPVEQIASTYHYFSNNKLYLDPAISLERFFEMVLDGSATRAFAQDHLRHALDWACFGYWLALWRRDLGAERVIALEMRAMLAAPERACAEVFARLGLPDCPGIDFRAANETYFVRNRALQRLNVALRAHLPKGRLYDAARAAYRGLNTRRAKPVPGAREPALRAALAARIAEREQELLAGL